MPRLLKRGTTQRLEGALGALRLALFGLAIPRCEAEGSSPSDQSSEIGLIGTSAELALSACVFEVLGPSRLVKPDGRFLVAREVLDAFRKMLRSGVPRLTVLSKGVGDASAHLDALGEATRPFSVLFSARAAGFHVGSGVSREVGLATATHVREFLETLGKGDRWAPYLRSTPSVPRAEREKAFIAEELARALRAEGSGKEAGRQLQSIFLVLPELAEESPEWVAAFDRVQVAPSKSDLTLLLKSLRGAGTGDLLRVGRGASGIAARIENENPNAIPVSLARFRRKTTDIGERFFLDINDANTYLDKGILHTPPIQSLYEYFAVGIDGLGLPDEVASGGLTGHEAWPFIAAALAYQGTPGPVFFVASRTRQVEEGQLLARLKAACEPRSYLRKRMPSYRPMIQTVISGSADEQSALQEEMTTEFQLRLERREELPGRIKGRFARRKPPAELAAAFLGQLEEEEYLSGLLLRFAKEPNFLGRASIPTLRDLLNAVTEREELDVLLELLRSDISKTVGTNVRRAIRALDFSQHFGTGGAEGGALTVD